MKSSRWIPALILLLALASTASAAEKLVLNGQGLRTKRFLGAMYELSLYVPEQMKGAHPKAIIEDGRPMDLVLVIQSKMITRARFVEATSEGFAKAAQSGYTSPQTREFLDQFGQVEFRRGDTITMRYENGGLVTLYRSAAADPKDDAVKLGRIPGREIKQALFAIWLGNDPVQDTLKQELLGAQK